MFIHEFSTFFNQGKEGGELVYEHGLNVQAVKTLDDKIFDLEEALEEANEKSTVNTPAAEVKTKAPAVIEVSSPVGSPQVVPSQVVQPVVQEAVVQESVTQTPTPKEPAPIETTDIEETVVTPTQASVQTVQTVEQTVPAPQ